MNLDVIFQQVFNLAGTFTPMLVVFLFLICAIGEFGAAVPYLLETIWLVSGYSVGNGTLSVLDLFLLWLAAQVGRQIGAMGLYYLGRVSRGPLLKFYDRYFRANLSEKLSGNGSGTFGFLRRINYLSPFSVALGRLFHLRILITLTLGVQKRWDKLLLGVLISSVVWDGIFLCLGAIVGVNVALKPFQMILYSLAGITALYALSFAFSRLLRLRTSRNSAG
jgi:membrane protein DedA with SNARE-associated domain